MSGHSKNDEPTSMATSWLVASFEIVEGYVARPERRLAAILAADVAGYSRLMAVDEAGTLARFNSLRSEVVDPKITHFKGRVVGSAGDSLLVEFASAVDAVQCAVETQERIALRNAELPEDQRIVFRMGVNLGDVIFERDTIHGDGVNIAARLEKLAKPGTVVLGRGVFDQVKGKLPYAFADLGDHAVKNIIEPLRVFAVAPANQAPEPPAPSENLPLPAKPSVAVLPFMNMSGDPEQEYFSDGITEDIITELSRSRSLFVIARNSCFVFKGRPVDIAEVGRKLGVRYVVEGSVRKASKRIRITAQLIEASTRSHIWAERFDRDLEDIFAVQDEVTERIVWALAGHVTKAEIDRSKRRRADNLDAYDLVLRGMESYYRSAIESMGEAIAFLAEASRLDPNSGKALAWLARALFMDSFVVDRFRESSVRAVEAATRALTLDDPEDWTDSVIAQVLAKRGDLHAAEVHLNRAVARNPTTAFTLEAMGYISVWHGRAAEALQIGEKLLRLDPLDQYHHADLLAYANYLVGNYERSLMFFRSIGQMNWLPDHAFLAACLGQLGRAEEAQATWRRGLELMPGFSVTKFMEIMAFRDLGYRKQWLDGLRKAGLPVGRDDFCLNLHSG